MRSLVIEDDYVNRSILQDFLEKRGSCDVTGNGEEGLTAFLAALDSGDPFRLVMLDMWLPGKNGREILQAIRQAEKERGVAPREEAGVVILTVDDDPELVMDAFRRGGATDYLLKPVDLNRLDAIIDEQGLDGSKD